MNDELNKVAELAQNPGPSWLAYSWIAVMAILGGVVRVVREADLKNKNWKQIGFIFFAELMTSLFVGLVTYFLCTSAGFKEVYTAAMVSISSYMGGRALTIAETAYIAFIKSMAKGGK